MLHVIYGILSVVTPAPMCRAPCPRRQLLSYVAHVGGGGGAGAAVFAKARGSTDEWCLTGRVAAGGVDAADDSFGTLARAAQLQQRLIVEHACRLHPHLRSAKKAPGIEMGVQTSGGVCAVPPAATGGDEPSPAEMLTGGFAGTPAGRGRHGRRDGDLAAHARALILVLVSHADVKKTAHGLVVGDQ